MARIVNWIFGLVLIYLGVVQMFPNSFLGFKYVWYPWDFILVLVMGLIVMFSSRGPGTVRPITPGAYVPVYRRSGIMVALGILIMAIGALIFVNESALAWAYDLKNFFSNSQILFLLAYGGYSTGVPLIVLGALLIFYSTKTGHAQIAIEQ